MEKESTGTPFSAALSHHLKKKWGAASALALKIGKSSGYISELTSGKKNGEEDVRRQIAEYFCFKYEDWLSLGRWILKGKDPELWLPEIPAHLMDKGLSELDGNDKDLVDHHLEPGLQAYIVAFEQKKQDEMNRLAASPFIQAIVRNKPDPSNISPGPPILRKIPVISWVQAGDWAEAEDPFPPGHADEWVQTTATSNQHAFALVVHGDSMEPEFVDGDIITVDPGRDYCSGSYVIAKNGEEATFKQLVLDGSSVFLKPLNQRYPIKDMTEVKFRIVGVVVSKEKRY